MQQLFVGFDQQLKLIRQQIFEKFNRELRKLSGVKDQVNEEFKSITDRLYQDHSALFQKLTAEMVVEGSGWGQQAVMHEADLNQQLKALIEQAREKEIDKLQMLTQKAAKDNLEQIINGPIYELNPSFWEEIKTPLVQELQDLTANCEHVLVEGFKCEQDETEEFILTLEQAVHSYTVDYIKRLFRDINTNLLRKFKKLFNKDDHGKNRDWRTLEENQVRDMWLKVKTQMEDVINEFKYIKLPKTTLSKGGLLEDAEIQEDVSPLRPSTPTPGAFSRSFTVMYAKLLTEQDLNKVRDRFHEDIDFVLEEAIRKHVITTTLYNCYSIIFKPHPFPGGSTCC